jgi:chaperonin GroES
VATKSKSKSKSKSKAPAKAKKPAAKPAIKAKSAAPIKKSQSVFSTFLKPLVDRLIVRIDRAEEKTSGGIIIPGSAGERPNRGEVVAAGPGRRNKRGQLRPLDVKAGDRVLFPQYAGTKITMNQQEFLILSEDEVLGIVT